MGPCHLRCGILRVLLADVPVLHLLPAEVSGPCILSPDGHVRVCQTVQTMCAQFLCPAAFSDSATYCWQSHVAWLDTARQQPHAAHCEVIVQDFGVSLSINLRRRCISQLLGRVAERRCKNSIAWPDTPQCCATAR